jgi:gluconate 2-dehydrogenase gamma chain
MWSYGPSSERFFTDEARKQVEALFAAILPASDTSPGAVDARAADYLDHFLASDPASYYEIDGWRKLYAEGLASLNTAATALYGVRSVALLSGDQVTALLEQLSKGSLGGYREGFDQKSFFMTLRGHCIEGCFSDPRWGGNNGGIMWRWYGYLQPAADFVRQPSQTSPGPSMEVE